MLTMTLALPSESTTQERLAQTLLDRLQFMCLSLTDTSTLGRLVPLLGLSRCLQANMLSNSILMVQSWSK